MENRENLVNPQKVYRCPWEACGYSSRTKRLLKVHCEAHLFFGRERVTKRSQEQSRNLFEELEELEKNFKRPQPIPVGPTSEMSPSTNSEGLSLREVPMSPRRRDPDDSTDD